jgi:hypothetical protein
MHSILEFAAMVLGVAFAFGLFYFASSASKSAPAPQLAKIKKHSSAHHR